MKIKHKAFIGSFIDGMSSFDIMPSFRFQIKPLSLYNTFSRVGKSFSNVGGIMYQIIETEKNAMKQHSIKNKPAITSLIVSVVPIAIATVKGMLKD